MEFGDYLIDGLFLQFFLEFAFWVTWVFLSKAGPGTGERKMTAVKDLYYNFPDSKFSQLTLKNYLCGKPAKDVKAHRGS